MTGQKNVDWKSNQKEYELAVWSVLMKLYYFPYLSQYFPLQLAVHENVFLFGLKSPTVMMENNMG